MRGLCATFLTLLMLAAGLAGCTDEATPDGDTARDAYPVAQAAAKAWDDGASLTMIMLVEAAYMPEGVDDADMQGTNVNERAMADGRADGWLFMFRGAEGMFMAVVDAGELVAGVPVSGEQGHELQFFGSASPIAEDAWPVDSDAAAEAAKEAAPQLKEYAAHPRGIALTILTTVDAKAQWLVITGVEDEAGEEFAAASVDAATGEAKATDLSDLFQIALRESGLMGARLQALEPTFLAGFELEMEHLAAYGVLEVRSSTPLDEVTVTVRPAAGDVDEAGPGAGAVSWSIAGSVMPTYSAMAIPAAAGEYELELRLDGVHAEARFYYCTDGLGLSQGRMPMDNPACDLVEEGQSSTARLASLW